VQAGAFGADLQLGQAVVVADVHYAVVRSRAGAVHGSWTWKRVAWNPVIVPVVKRAMVAAL
jgi:hypothetical protein